MTKKNRNPKSDENKLEAIEKEAETFNPLFGIGCVTLRGKGGSFAEAGRLKREAQAQAQAQANKHTGEPKQ